jgi:hypothetical protein
LPPKIVPRLRAGARDEPVDQVDDLAILGGKAADRPVGAEDQAVRAEARKQVIEIPRDLIRGPGRVIRLRDEPGYLAIKRRHLRHVGDRVRPGLPATVRDVGLRTMIEDQPRRRRTPRRDQIAEATNMDRLARFDENVVAETALDRRPDPAHEVRCQQEIVVRLVLDDMPKANQLGRSQPSLQPLGNIAGPQIDPADHAHDSRIGSRELQQPGGLGLGLSCLHGDTAIDRRAVQQRHQIGRRKVPGKHAVGIDPVERRRRI